MERLRSRLGLRGFEGVSSNGLSGGLALYWHESLYMDIKEINESWFDAYIRVSPNDPIWRVTPVYGEPRVENWHLVCGAIRQLHAQDDMSWLVAGDFNEAMWAFEHMSVTPRPPGQMLALRDTLETCGLIDLGFSGIPFTYDNKRSRRANVQARK